MCCDIHAANVADLLTSGRSGGPHALQDAVKGGGGISGAKPKVSRGHGEHNRISLFVYPSISAVTPPLCALNTDLTTRHNSDSQVKHRAQPPGVPCVRSFCSVCSKHPVSYHLSIFFYNSAIHKVLFINSHLEPSIETFLVHIRTK